MLDMNNARTCLTCSGPVPDGILDGLCPRCAAVIAFVVPAISCRMVLLASACQFVDAARLSRTRKVDGVCSSV